MKKLGAKVIGIMGNTSNAQLKTDFEQLGKETGSVDASGKPYVFLGADAAASTVISQGIRDLASTLPLDMAVKAEDDPQDAVDAVASFVDYIEVLASGSAECVDWKQRADSDGDGREDTFKGVPPGTPVCWTLHAKKNVTVKPTDKPQIFKASLKLLGNQVTLLDTRMVYFVVPPELSGPHIE